MNNVAISDAIRQYLKKCGFTEKQIELCNAKSRLYHDLGVYGEIAWGHVEVLMEVFGVEMSDFVFENYFPPEFEGKNIFTTYLIFFFPYIARFFKKEIEYKPITLEMIEKSIVAKKWMDT